MAAIDGRHAPDGSEWLLAELELQRRMGSLEAHPYLVAWRGGDLSAEDLWEFAVQHHHVVVATARAARRAAERASGSLGERLTAIADDAEADVERWRAFVRVTGRSRPDATGGDEPLRATADCVRALAGSPAQATGATLGVLWATMVTQPDIVPVQRAALFKGHGLDAAGATWFDRHAASAGRVGPLVAALEDVVVHEREDPYRVLGAAKTTFAVLRGFFDGLGDDRATRARIGAAA